MLNLIINIMKRLALLFIIFFSLFSPARAEKAYLINHNGIEIFLSSSSIMKHSALFDEVLESSDAVMVELIATKEKSRPHGLYYFIEVEKVFLSYDQETNTINREISLGLDKKINMPLILFGLCFFFLLVSAAVLRYEGEFNLWIGVYFFGLFVILFIAWLGSSLLGPEYFL